MKKAVVIGAGIGGIAVAIRLAAGGYKVTVFDKNQYTGGKLAEMHLDGYRFDLGPSLFTLPHLVDELFILCGENPRDHFSYTSLDVICHYFFSDDKHIKAYSDIHKFAAEAQKILGEPTLNTIAHLNESKLLWDLTADLFIFKSFRKWSTFLNKDFLFRLLNIHKLRLLSTMNQVNSSRFKTKEMTQLFNRYATYNGSDPYKAPATLNVIPHVEFGTGAYLPDNGMFDIPKSLTSLAKRHGVDFELGIGVSEIKQENNTVTGVVTDNGFYDADIVVSNSDIVNTYRYLLGNQTKADKILKQERSTSAMVFNWGINAEFPELGVHNIFFAEDYKAEFQALFKGKKIYDDPTIYIHINSKISANDAPKGCESWFVMVNAPCNTGQDWKSEQERMRTIILQKLTRVLKKDISSLIKCEWILDPAEIEFRTGSVMGSLYGSSSNSRLSAFLRHPNHSSDIKGLYFCGGSVHPGGGIPICLSSAKIAAEDIFDRE